MPPRPHKPCRKPGCSRLTQDASGYCAGHVEWGQQKAEADTAKRRKQADDRRGTAHERGYDRAWARVRGAFLRAHPICNRCNRPASTAHHIKPVEEAPDLRLLWSNLEALCRDCHEKHHGRMK